LFFLSFYYLTNAGWYKIGDESAMTHLARSIATTGKIGMESSPPIEPEQEGEIVRGWDGRLYYKWGLGQSLIQVPYILLHQAIRGFPKGDDSIEGGHSVEYLVSEWTFLMLCPSAVSALGCSFFFLLCLRLGWSTRISLFLTLVYGLATMIWPYAKSLMSEATLNAAVLGSVYGAVSYGMTSRRRWLVLSSVCMGMSIITKPTSLVFGPFLVAYLLAKSRSRKGVRDLFMYFIPALLFFLGLQAWHNFVRYESIWSMGSYGRWGMLGFCTPLYVGLWGLLASPGKSFFVYAPAALLGIASLRGFYFRYRLEALLFFGLTASFIVLHARWGMWSGDWAWGPRFLLPITPYIILPAGLLFESWKVKSRFARTVAVALIILSTFVQVLGAAIHPFAFIKARHHAVATLLSPNTTRYTYAQTYSENALMSFSPMFSHVIGNWWLFKHMVVSYDLQSDTPWKVIGNFHIGSPPWVEGNRVLPFWWPVTLPLISPSSSSWVYAFAAVSLLTAVWCLLKLRCLLKEITLMPPSET